MELELLFEEVEEKLVTIMERIHDQCKAEGKTEWGIDYVKGANIAGAKRVLFSQPADNDIDATSVCGVNDAMLSIQHKIVSAASCTTNAIVPVIKVRRAGMQTGHSL